MNKLGDTSAFVIPASQLLLTRRGKTRFECIPSAKYLNYIQCPFKMNIAKTKVMVVDNTPINVNNVLIENVQGYVYLGQHYSLKDKNQDKEIQRRIMAGWAAYAKHRDIFKSNLAICQKRQVQRRGH